jgi:hypothetical protein
MALSYSNCNGLLPKQPAGSEDVRILATSSARVHDRQRQPRQTADRQMAIASFAYASITLKALVYQFYPSVG